MVINNQRPLKSRHQRMRIVNNGVTPEARRRIIIMSWFIMIVCTTLLCMVAVGTFHVLSMRKAIQNITEPIKINANSSDCKASTEIESRDFLEHYLTLDLIFATLFLFSLLLLTGIEKKFAHIIFICLLLYIVFVIAYFFNLAGNKDIIISRPILIVKLIVLFNVIVIMIIFYYRQITARESRTLPMIPVRDRIAVAVINSTCRSSRRTTSFGAVPPKHLIDEVQRLQTCC